MGLGRRAVRAATLCSYAATPCAHAAVPYLQAAAPCISRRQLSTRCVPPPVCISRCELRVDLAALGLDAHRAYVRAPQVERGLYPATCYLATYYLTTYHLTTYYLTTKHRTTCHPATSPAISPQVEGFQTAIEPHPLNKGAPVIDVEPGRGWLLVLEQASPASAEAAHGHVTGQKAVARARAAAVAREWAAAALVEVPQHTPDAEAM